MLKQKVGPITSVLAKTRSVNADRYIDQNNVLVIYRTGDAVGQQIAKYYMSRRNIPAVNLLALDFVGAATGSVTDLVFIEIASQIHNYIVSSTLDISAIVLCGHFPMSVTGTSIFNV